MDFLLFNCALLYYTPVPNKKYVEWQTECMLTLKMVSKDFAEDCCTFKTNVKGLIYLQNNFDYLMM